jgi:mannose-6-phosphate isomerase-like protein (cupin superfamily)
VHAGDVIWNPLTGEKALLVESAAESDGARVVADFGVEAGGFVPGGVHMHDHCAEHLEIRAGRITFVIDGRQRAVGPGEHVTVAPGVWHEWWNASEDEVLVRVRIEPALHFEQAIMVIWGLCADGRTDQKGRPSPLLGALMATRFRPEIRYRRPPDAVQRLLFPALAALARRRGLERTIERYLDPTTHPSAEPGLGRLPERVLVTGARR